MMRFMGIMPSDEVEIEKIYRDETGARIRIQAGPKGYTIIYPDHSTDYSDINATAEDNLNAALNRLKINGITVYPMIDDTDSSLSECECDCECEC